MAGDAKYGFSPHSAGAIGMLLEGDVDPYKALRGELGSGPGLDMTTGGDFAAKPGKRVCSLQLAHPSADGKSIFWFNGGILRDKFVGNGPIGDFQVWSLEPAKWELYKDNICCIYLEEEWEMSRVYPVSEEDKTYGQCA
jgi:hypothetical protein